MSREEIINMAREAGLLFAPETGAEWSAPIPGADYPLRLAAFAALIAAAEREACAEVLVVKIKRHEQFAEEAALRGEYGEVTVLRSTARKLSECVAEIRARGNT